MFIELGLPRRGTVENKAVYYVGSEDEDLKLFMRNDSKTIDDGCGDLDLYTFDTQEATHEAAAKYYNRHGWAYPHGKEWADEVLVAIINSVPVEKTLKSETMRFE